MNLKTKFETVCEMYVEAFMRKHGFFDDRTGEYADYEWVADEVGSILCLADYFINFDDIRRDIDEEVPKDKYFEYYDHCIETEIKINYKSYLMGGRVTKPQKQKSS
ncbi:MAG TPA: hypothetical protein GXX64_11105 [Bacteroidales bacterium]|nr:hypothetical protein [Bacteroidales bacterium]